MLTFPGRTTDGETRFAIKMQSTTRSQSNQFDFHTSLDIKIY